MAISQVQTMTRSYVPDLAAIRGQLEVTRTAFRRRLTSLSDADLARPSVISKWTIKELLTHIMLQEEQAVPMMIKRARKSKPMPKVLDTRFGHWMNYQLAVRTARKLNRDTLAQRYEAAHERLLVLLTEVRDHEWDLPTGYPDGRPLTMETVFYVPVEHFNLHDDWIRQTLER